MTENKSSTRPLEPNERALLNRLCADEWTGVEQARLQVPSALYGGPSHEGKDNCFDLEVEGEHPAIPLPNGPAYGLIVYDGDEPTGMLDLWVWDGKLHSIEHSWFTDEPGPMPTADQLRPNG